MRQPAGAFRAYAELARVSNLPTCVSNSLVGCALGAGGGLFSWSSIPPVAVAICLLYVAGMALNDIFDHSHDRIERPERPIPSGRISLPEAWRFAAASALLGLGLLANTSAQALNFGLLLVAFIVLYDLLHKRHPSSVVLMGACRGTIYLVGMAAVGWPGNLRAGLWLAGILALYTVLITVVARSENARTLDARRWLALALPPPVFASALVVEPQRSEAPIVFGLLLLLWLGWAARAVLKTPADPKAAIQRWISGMCLVDAFFLSLLQQPEAALLALACFALTVYSHRRIAGT
ncbi:MAG: UbiA family prenyltransferase [Bryobacterales bacterium]